MEDSAFKELATSTEGKQAARGVLDTELDRVGGLRQQLTADRTEYFCLHRAETCRMVAVVGWRQNVYGWLLLDQLSGHGSHRMVRTAGARYLAGLGCQIQREVALKGGQRSGKQTLS
ncbi:hypothetical protein ElyMa_004281700 [Elysia marginata]|uniref:Uncharacterized protein n=1 Tax=Elysia marginata TaxID=1093978 RepID=A0AAV4GWJ1_9GAST|nr:hypothetical protein ElyMa_004281700 [Elysia marginata]